MLDEVKKETFNSDYLRADNSNYMAIELYREFGFREMRKKKNYHRENSSDVVIMMKELN